jgi:hypothetical protein
MGGGSAVKVTFPNRASVPDGKIREGIEDRLHFALSRFGSHVEQVSIRLAELDAGEDRDGSQVLCRLSVRMKQLGSFSVESVNDDDDPLAAVSWAVDRAAKRVQRILDCRRDSV